ncbi:MAG: hypothetical protein LBM27_02295 [Lactobacillaceae bacterium]|jgi:hypothetical protein|nr:hypothetical protein [Lactobacillaceae bacterium]
MATSKKTSTKETESESKKTSKSNTRKSRASKVSNTLSSQDSVSAYRESVGLSTMSDNLSRLDAFSSNEVGLLASQTKISDLQTTFTSAADELNHVAGSQTSIQSNESVNSEVSEVQEDSQKSLALSLYQSASISEFDSRAAARFEETQSQSSREPINPDDLPELKSVNEMLQSAGEVEIVQIKQMLFENQSLPDADQFERFEQAYPGLMPAMIKETLEISKSQRLVNQKQQRSDNFFRAFSVVAISLVLLALIGFGAYLIYKKQIVAGILFAVIPVLINWIAIFSGRTKKPKISKEAKGPKQKKSFLQHLDNIFD